MKKVNNITAECRRILATKDFRDIPAVEKAVRLVIEHKHTFAATSVATGVSIGSIQAGIKALGSGRKISQHGRPAILNEEMMAKLSLQIDYLNQTHVKATREVVRAEVPFFCVTCTWRPFCFVCFIVI